jgi:hypothetical protein
VDFEFAPEKSAANKAKHGLDFEEARAIWNDPNRLTVPSAYPGEPRQLVIGRIGENNWTAVITWRGNRIRLISVRRSRHNEKELYENKQQAAAETNDGGES